MVTLRLGKVEIDERPSGTVVKRYPDRDTELYKCWGSGAGNEAVARLLLGPVVPAIESRWRSADAECVALEWLDARRLADDPTEARLLAAGAVLGRMHVATGAAWGSLDGSHTFAGCRDAVASRVAAAVTLVRAGDPDLARLLDAWLARAVAAVPLATGPPVLVHGDFGPSNILVRGDDLWVIDWEHARWGHPAEDWAKISLACRFPEPNGFAAPAVAAVEAGWTAVTGQPVPRGPLGELMEVYLAACLGCFFADRARLGWVREVVTR